MLSKPLELFGTVRFELTKPEMEITKQHGTWNRMRRKQRLHKLRAHHRLRAKRPGRLYGHAAGHFAADGLSEFVSPKQQLLGHQLRDGPMRFVAGIRRQKPASPPKVPISRLHNIRAQNLPSR